tara:strand:- start:437 stop:595 length:159 start_codon:yes stop_codon:yes gene_type:complete
MLIYFIVGAIITILICMMGEDFKYWKDKPMDHTNFIPIVILIIALTSFLAIL